MEPSLAWWKLYVWVSVLFDVMFVGFLVVYRRVCACGYCLRMVALCDVWCGVIYIVDLLNRLYFEKGVSIKNCKGVSIRYCKGASVRWTTFEVRRWLSGSITRLSAWKAYGAKGQRIRPSIDVVTPL
jgi:hypothetical protein